jgi:hypothetical protein
MPLKRHAISTNTPKNVVLGSGILVKNLVYSGSDWTYDELGATSGGGKISYEREYIDLDVDGKTVKVENFDVKVAETGLMTLNLAECNAETLVTALCLKADTTNPVTGLAKYKPSKENAYVEKLGFVGYTAEGKPIIVIFPKAICLSAFELEVKNKEQAVMALEFSAVAPAESENYEELGIEFYFPTETV